MPFTNAEDAREAAYRSHAPVARARGLLSTIDQDDPAGWAERVAAALPPLTGVEAAAVGRLAAALDARRTADGGDAA